MDLLESYFSSQRTMLVPTCTTHTTLCRRGCWLCCDIVLAVAGRFSTTELAALLASSLVRIQYWILYLILLRRSITPAHHHQLMLPPTPRIRKEFSQSDVAIVYFFCVFRYYLPFTNTKDESCCNRSSQHRVS